MRKMVGLLWLFALSPVPLFAGVVQIEFTGTLTSTTDATGGVFHNGTAPNSGAGTLISGLITWDLEPSIPLGIYRDAARIIEWDVNHSYYNPAQDVVRTWLTVGGTGTNRTKIWGLTPVPWWGTNN